MGRSGTDQDGIWHILPFLSYYGLVAYDGKTQEDAVE
jgi:hypothetical protein